MTLLVAGLSAVTVAAACAVILGVMPSSLRAGRRKRRPDPLAGAIQRAGLSMRPGSLRFLAAACGAGAGLAVYAISGIAMVAAAPGVLATALPRWWVGRRADQRQQAIQRAWPDAIRDVVASITAGLSLPHAVERLAHAGPDPLRDVFQRFAMTVQIVGFAAALEAVRHDLADATSDRIIEVLLVAHERGGAIVPVVLRDLAVATSRDIWLLEQVDTESLEQRINARAVFALPWLVLVAITFQDGPFREFYASAAGMVVIAIGGVASAIGMALVSRLGAQPAEPRVLDGGR
jgi:tight adherence protein B